MTVGSTPAHMQGLTLVNSEEQSPADTIAQQSSKDTIDSGELNQRLWWCHTSDMLHQMLLTAGYSGPRVCQYLKMFQSDIVPSAGPCTLDHGKGIFKHALTGMGALEFLLKFRSSMATVRIALEPTSDLAGTNDDPCNKIRLREVLHDFKARPGFEDLDLELSEQLRNFLVVSDSEIRQLQSQNRLQGLPSWTQHILLMDLRQDQHKIETEMLLYPMVKATALGVPVLDMIFAAIREVDTKSRYGAAVNLLEDYLSSTRSTTLGGLMLSCDLVPSSQARIRVVVYETRFNVDRAAELWTLGGQLTSSENTTGLEMLRKLFMILGPEIANLKEGVPMMFTYELSPCNPRPWPTVTLPLLGINDRTACNYVAAILKELGWDNHAKTYTDRLASFALNNDTSSSQSGV